MTTSGAMKTSRAMKTNRAMTPISKAGIGGSATPPRRASANSTQEKSAELSLGLVLPHLLLAVRNFLQAETRTH